MKISLKSTVNCQLSTVNLPGQSLIEVLVSLGVVIVLVVSLITTALVTQKAARTAKNNTQATKLVEQNIEQMRIYRDRAGFKVIPTGVTGSCYTLTTSNSDPASWTLPTCTTGETITLNNTDFTRKIEIGPDPAGKTNSRLVVVTVTWQDSGGTQTVKNNTFLTDWEGYQ